MIKQRPITIKTAGATLTLSEMGDIVVNSASDVTITLPAPSGGLWYRISNVNTGIVTVFYGSALTTLKQTEQCLCLANATSAWFFSKGGGAMTKAEIEAVLTGEISTHSHAPELPVGGTTGQALMKNSATDRDVKWGDVAGGSGGGTSFADVATGTGTITTTGWEANTGDYDLKLILTVDGITADDKVFVTPDPDDMDIAIEAELCTVVDSGAGTLTFYCKTTPTATIGFSYIKFTDGIGDGYISINIDGGEPDSTYSPTLVEANALVPVGGTEGQILAKASGSDRDVGWIDAPSGGAYYENAVDEPPTSPSTYDDEFAGPSLDAKWSWLNQIGAVATVDGKLHISAPTSNGVASLVQTAPTGDFTVTVKLSIFSKLVDYLGAGIYLYNTATSKGISFIKQHRSTNTYLSAYKWDGANATTSTTTIGYTAYSKPKYLRIRKSSGTLYMEASIDGVNWVTVYTEALSTFITAIDRIGVGNYRMSANDVISCFDWFRVVEV